MGGGRRSDSISVDMQPYQAFSAASRTLITNVVVEQNFLADFFHYAPAKPSTGSKKGRKVDAYDPSTTSARITFNEWVTGGWESIGMWSVPRKYKVQSNINTEVKNILELLFGNLKAHLDSMIDMGTRFDPSQALGMIAAVEELEDMCKGTDQLFAIRLLEAAKKHLTTIFDQFVQAQMAAIDDKKLVTKKRSGVQPAVRIFPKFLSHMESLSGLNSPEAQELSNQTISKVGQHILDTFVNLVTESKTAAQGNDKDLLKEYLNSLILALTNLSTLRDGLAPLVSSSKSERLGTFNVAKHFYNISSRHAATFQHDYVMILIHRPMGRLIDFFSVVDDAYSRQQSPELIPGHNRASLKKLVAAHTQKEVKEAVKLLYKRAEKHLGSQPALLSAVWREVREDMLKLHQSFTATLTKFYTDSGITLEFRQADLLQWLDEQSR
ncbi:Exocyst complex component 1 [Zancudomyces culisetae]|nr:Exocyst complex component 1 [Zancudomyces culisetae]|eukprot:OMH80048.1 Exocyst complex component 1 [Zancudomyces culisetae]